jgi:polyphosphate glucokinase
MNYLGIDIGCTSIKYGLVCLEGEIRVENFDFIFISQSARIRKYIDALTYLFERMGPYQAVGFGFPSVVLENKVRETTPEFHEIWNHVEPLVRAKQVPYIALNDADAAGVAEVYRRESEELRKGVTLVITLGTGVGSAIFLDGNLLPNTEFGMLQMHGMKAEDYMAASVKTRESLSVADWSLRLQEYLLIVEKLLTPDHIVLGGGISAEFEDYRSYLNIRAPLQPAHYRNQAGVIGAAMYAAYKSDKYELVVNPITDPGS